MEPIDAALLKFDRLAKEIADYSHSMFTEQDACVKAIDRILTEVLGWPLAELSLESPVDKGFIDYRCTISGASRLIVEAKKDGRDLGLSSHHNGKSYLLRGAVFTAEAAKEGISQGIRYCGQKNAELAAITNGRQWIVFRGSRLGDGKDSLDGMAFAFDSLEGIRSSFKLFFELLSYYHVERCLFRAHFQEAEGQPIRTHIFRKPVKTEGDIRALAKDGLSVDIDRVMTSFFQNLSGDKDPDMIVDCFVTSTESNNADIKLARISEELSTRIRDIDTGAAVALTEVIERLQRNQRNEFVLLVGTKGAGKSTFVDRFFRHILKQETRAQCYVCKIDLAKCGQTTDADIVAWLESSLLVTIESEIFHEGPPSFEELQGMFFDEYSRWMKGPFSTLYERDKQEFKIKFGEHIEKKRGSDPQNYITRMLKHAAGVRKKAPCIVFDNADHFKIELQECIFRFARAVFEESVSMVIVPITDKTSWNLSRQGALQSFHCESFFLPTPTPRKVLERRIQYLEKKLAGSEEECAMYLVGRGVTLSLPNLRAFAASLHQVFLNTGSVSDWIGSLCNHDIRRGLDLTRDIVASPHLKVIDLVKAYVSKETNFLKPVNVKKAIVRGAYNIYPAGRHRYVQNVFNLNTDIYTSPLLGIRMLRLLKDACRPEVDDQDSFVAIDHLTSYFTAMEIEPRVVGLWVEAMLKTGLCLGYDPTVDIVTETNRIEISPSGLQHLQWGLRDWVYLDAMAETTPILESEVHRSLSNIYKEVVDRPWIDIIQEFISYLITEDSKYCVVPDHEAYSGQLAINIELNTTQVALQNERIRGTKH